jgi:hypothetical protein
MLALALAVAYLAYQTFDSHSWPEVSGKVIGSYVDEDHVHDHDTGFHGHTYRAVVKYLYLVKSVSYEGEDTVKTFDTYSGAERYLNEQYWKNQHIRVLYNPNIPSLSTLRRAAI